MMELLQKNDWLLTVADIVLVAIVIYQLLRFVRESTAIRILFILPFVILLCVVARFIGLLTFSWFLDNFLSSVILLLVVIFQYDIRRAMLSFSRSRILKADGPDETDNRAEEVINQLVEAARALSERRNGALIVIARDMSLEQFITVGTEIDAKVTCELLASIFLPYSPIHDGAVIIQNGKLISAGCFLPLTQNPEIAKELGTRHRAAIGLTEVVDAVVIVVSEESGAVSVVSGGSLTSDLGSAALHKLLRRMVEARWLQ